MNLDEIYYNLGLSYHGCDMHKEAIDTLRECIQANPHGKVAPRAEEVIDMIVTYLEKKFP